LLTHSPSEGFLVRIQGFPPTKERMSTQRRATKKVLNIKEEVVEKDDPRIRICKYCKRPGILLMGYHGYGFYTLAKHGKKYKTTKTTNHHASKAEWALKCKKAQYEQMVKDRDKREAELKAAREKKKKAAKKKAAAAEKKKKAAVKKPSKKTKKA
jgi:hypothetical protein